MLEAGDAESSFDHTLQVADRWRVFLAAGAATPSIKDAGLF